jgi:large subunit ribosomal protein L25
MGEKVILNVEKRDPSTSSTGRPQENSGQGNGVKALRAENKIPAVFYGRKEKSTPITISEKEFQKVWEDAGESTVISLHGVGRDIDALIHDVQFHPVTDKPIHADFYVIEKDRKITVEVPLEFIGEAPAEKAGLVLVKVLHEIEIESLPANLPQHIEVDLGVLVDAESQILIKDLKLPEGVSAIAESEEVVVSVTEAREEELETPSEAPDMASIEVEKKGKSEDASDEGNTEGDEKKGDGK